MPQSPPVFFVLSPEGRSLDHHPGDEHPDIPERLAACERGARSAGLPPETCARLASVVELERVHTSAHVSLVLAPRAEALALDHETHLGPGSGRAAALAAGCAVALVERLLGGEHAGFALARPPGHHAGSDLAMGYCLFNNVAVAAAHALAQGIERVAILDWDVHRGNGTQEIFQRDPRVLVVDLHQEGIFPDEGGKGDTPGAINIALPPGSALDAYLGALEARARPAFERHRPGLLLVSCGLDAHERDPIGGMRLSDDDFGQLATWARRAAAALCAGRLGLVLEGGYALEALEGATGAIVRALGQPDPTPRTSP